jgi:hypothetical protein
VGLFDSFYAELTCPNCGCRAMVEAQTKDFENAMLTYSVGEMVEPLGQAEFRGLAACRWCHATGGARMRRTLEASLAGPIDTD